MKKTRKSLAADFMTMLQNIDEPAKRLSAHPEFDKTRDLIVGYTTIEKGVGKVHYQCLKCGAHVVKDGTYAYSTMTCPHCGTDTVQTSRVSSNISRANHLYVEETLDGFFAMEYASYVSFPDESEWYTKTPEMKMRVKRAYLFDRNVGVLMADWYPRLAIANNNSKTQKTIQYLLHTRSDGFGMSHERWTDLTLEVKQFLKDKEAAQMEKAKSKQPVVDLYQYYKAQPLDEEALYNIRPMFVGSTYDRSVAGTTMRIWCTKCGKYHDAPRLRNDAESCPHCGFSIDDYDSLNGYSATAYNRVAFSTVKVENTTLPDNDLLLRLIHIEYEITREEGETEPTLKKHIREMQRVFLGKKMRIYGADRVSIYNKVTHKKLEGYFRANTKQVMNNDEELLAIVNQSCLARSGLAETWGLVKGYKMMWPAPNLNYIKGWYQDSRLELLAKANIPHLAEYYIYHPDDLRPNTTSLYEVLGLTKPVVKVVQQNNLGFAEAYQFNRLYAAEESMTMEKYERMRNHELDISRMLYIKATYGISFDKIMSYLDSVYDHQCIVRKAALTEWYDYLIMAKKLSMDLTQKGLMFPASLKKEHDIAVFAYNALKQEVDAKKFAEVAAENKAKYEYARGEFVAIIPQTPEDIIEEATKQHNCLRSYIERVRDGATVVAFIRRKDAIKDSYVSVEIYNGELSQVKLAYNKDPHNPKLNEFLSHWCKACGIKPNTY